MPSIALLESSKTTYKVVNLWVMIDKLMTAARFGMADHRFKHWECEMWVSKTSYNFEEAHMDGVNGYRFGGRLFGRSAGGVESTAKFLNAFSGDWGGRSTRRACLCAGAFARSAPKVSADAPCAPLSSRCIIIRDPTIVCKHSIIRITSLNKLRDRILIRFTYQKFLIVSLW